MYRGRLKHGRHFTYKNVAGDVAITLVCAGVQGAFADERHPYASHGPWLQVFIGEEFVDPFLADLEKALGSKKVRDAYLSALFPGLRPDFISQPWRTTAARQIWAEAWEQGYNLYLSCMYK